MIDVNYPCILTTTIFAESSRWDRAPRRPSGAFRRGLGEALIVPAFYSASLRPVALRVPAQAYLAWAFERLGTHRDLFALPLEKLTPAPFKKSLR